MKKRLDILVTERGLAPSREKAKAYIMSGIVYVNGQKEDKAGDMFEDTDLTVEVRGETLPFVSRGGLKLDKAMKVFPIDVTGGICLDIGASTGGFTDCMLQNGASKVYAIDVGHGQLDWKLRNDERVVCMEKTNFRYVTDKEVPEAVDFAATDVSFISLTKILTPAFNLIKCGGKMVCLIKPQFETEREKVGKKGVVRDKTVHIEVIEKVIRYAVGIGFTFLDLSYSPIRGPEGNIEYLLFIGKDREGAASEINDESEDPIDDNLSKKIKETVEASHGELEKQ